MNIDQLDEIVDKLNGFGRYQKIRYFLICLSGFFPPISSFMHSFLAASPAYSCVNSTFDNVNDSMFRSMDYYYSAAYQHKCYSIVDKYEYNKTEKCTSWHFDKTYYQSTLTEDWGLICDDAMWRSNLQSIYYIGIVFGYLGLTKISKLYGQKPSLLISLTLILLGNSMIIFGPRQMFGVVISYIFLASGRFLMAIGSQGISINSYKLVMETIGKKNRKHCILFFEFVFPIGQLLLVFAAYFFRKWNQLLFISLFPCLPFFIYIYLSDESFVFLLKQKRYNDIREILQNIAKTNKIEIDQTIWESFLLEPCKNNDSERVAKNKVTKAIQPHLLLNAIIVLNWSVNSFIFHGIGLRCNDLGINPYISFSISAVLELICSLFTNQMLKFKFRRKFYFSLMVLTGTCCTTFYFSRILILNVVSALMAKFCVSASYAIIRLYTSEFLESEHIKLNYYMAKCTLLARIGAVFAPFVIGIGDYHFKKLPFLIFGIVNFATIITCIKLPRIELEENFKMKIDDNEIYRSQVMSNNWTDGENIFNHSEPMSTNLMELLDYKRTKMTEIAESEDYKSCCEIPSEYEERQLDQQERSNL